MRRTVPFLVAFLALALSLPTQAAEIARGFTTIDVAPGGRRNATVSVAFVVVGPAEGPLQVTVRRGKDVIHQTEVPIAPLAKGESRPVSLSFQRRGELGGPWRLQVDGPGGRVGIEDTVLQRGPDREVFLGDDRITEQTWYERRDRFAGHGWLDIEGDHLAVEFFLKVRGPGETAVITCKRGKEVIGSDDVPVSGVKGQVVRVRGYCKKGGADEPDSATRSLGDGVYIDEDMRPDTLEQPSDGIDIDADAENLADAFTTEDALAKPGRWRVEVRTGKTLRRVLSFAVRQGKIVSQTKRAGPMRPVQVKVLVR